MFLQTVIEARQVVKRYDTLTAVKGLSFEVPEAVCFGLLGPNGAGKTTMMKMIYGKALRSNPGESELSVFGFDPQHEALHVKSIAGVVPQEDNLDEELSVEQNLYVYSRFYGLKRSVARQRINELLDFMELTEKRKDNIRELSGGMKRRLTIARALLNQPKLLILDEPTTGLDPQVRQMIWDKLRKLKKEGVTILLTTHYMEEAYSICDNILIMHRGEKVMEGNPHRLILEHMEPYILQVHSREALACLEGKIAPDVRAEHTEEAAMFFSNQLSSLESLTRCLKPGEFFIRQTNLEDLFLKTTGRGLNE